MSQQMDLDQGQRAKLLAQRYNDELLTYGYLRRLSTSHDLHSIQNHVTVHCLNKYSKKYILIKTIQSKEKHRKIELVLNLEEDKHYVRKSIHISNLIMRMEESPLNEIKMLNRLNHPNIIKTQSPII